MGNEMIEDNNTLILGKKEHYATLFETYGIRCNYRMSVRNEKTLLSWLKSENIELHQVESCDYITFSCRSTDDDETTYDSWQQGARSFSYNDNLVYWVSAPYLADILTEDNQYHVIGSDNIEVLHEIHDKMKEFSKFKVDSIAIYDSSDGGWRKLTEDEKADIKKLSWDSLIVPDEMKNSIKKETDAFFSGELKSIYSDLGLPYKRGFIFIGMPGCGKTLTSKIIANMYDVPFLYVRNITRLWEFEMIYREAVSASPCVLVFEDLDSLITPDTRTKFLNILDGLTSCENVLTIATTNHPEKIDPALLNRPSRFDRKWIFSPPGKETKTTFIKKKLADIYSAEEIKEASCAIDVIGNESKTYTYTMLQEMVINAAYNNKVNNMSLNESLIVANCTMKEQLDFGNGVKAEEKMNKPSDGYCEPASDTVGFRNSA